MISEIGEENSTLNLQCRNIHPPWTIALYECVKQHGKMPLQILTLLSRMHIFLGLSSLIEPRQREPQAEQFQHGIGVARGSGVVIILVVCCIVD